MKKLYISLLFVLMLCFKTYSNSFDLKINFIVNNYERYDNICKNIIKQIEYESVSTLNINNYILLQNTLLKLRYNYDLNKFALVNQTSNDIKIISYTNIAEYFKTISNKPKSFYYYTKILDIAGLEDDIKADVYVNLGKCIVNDTNHIILTYYNKALEIYKTTKNLKGICRVYNNIGCYYYRYNIITSKDKTYSKAFKNFETSLSLAEVLNYDEYMAKSYNNIGSIYIQQKIYHKALEYIHKALIINIKEKNDNNISSNYNNIGIIYKNIGDYKTSIEYFKKSLEVSKKLKDNDKILTNLLLLSKSYKYLGEYQKAYLYQFESMTYHENKYNEISQQQLKELYIKYNNDEYKKQVDGLQKENDIKNLKLRNSNITNVMFSLIVVSLIVILLYVYQFIKSKYEKNKMFILKQTKNTLDYINSNITSILESNNNGLVLIDLNGRVKHFNTSANNIVKNYFKKYLVLEEDFKKYINCTIYLDKFNVCFNNVLDTKSTCTTELVVFDGKWYSVTFFPVLQDKILVGMTMEITDITEIKINEMILKTSLKEKTALIKEIHHRVKNNIQLIISLLNLQKPAFTLDDRNRLEIFQDRIYTISHVHELLYDSNDLSEISINKFIKKLYNTRNTDINLTLNGDVIVDIELSVPIALALNELINNSIKHSKCKNIDIMVFSDTTNSNYIIKYFDDGIGVNKLEDKVFGLGLQLVELLVENNLRGEYIMKNDGGFNVEMKFPFYKKINSK